MIATCSRQTADWRECPGHWERNDRCRPPSASGSGQSHQTFRRTQPLDQVSLKIPPGSFHALIGENGAGKSTIVKCLMGFYHADSGEFCIDHGKPARILAARRPGFGLGMVFQHFTLVPSMTVAENLVLARPVLPFVIDWKAEWRALEGFHGARALPSRSRRAGWFLAAGQKQKVEILKELYLQTRLLILDEPTSVLTPAKPTK